MGGKSSKKGGGGKQMTSVAETGTGKPKVPPPDTEHNRAKKMKRHITLTDSHIGHDRYRAPKNFFFLLN